MEIHPNTNKDHKNQQPHTASCHNH
jgi:hypothetical protein